MKTICLFVLFWVSVRGDLMCYDCDPSSDGQCHNPVENNIKVTHCPDSGIQQCFAIYYTPNYGSKIPKGVYRGCYQDNTNLVCHHLQKDLPHGSISACKFCGTNKCNTHHIYRA